MKIIYQMQFGWVLAVIPIRDGLDSRLGGESVEKFPTLLTVIVLLVLLISSATRSLPAAAYTNWASLLALRSWHEPLRVGALDARAVLEQAVALGLRIPRIEAKLDSKNIPIQYQILWLSDRTSGDGAYHRYMEALASFYEQQAGQTDDPRMYYLWGLSLVELGRVDQAGKAFEQFLQFASPAEHQREAGIAAYHLATLAETAGDLRQAAALYQNAMEWNPGLLEAYDRLFSLNAFTSVNLAAWQERLRTVQPHYSLAMPFSGEWRLEGYDIPDGYLDLAGLLPVYFYWRGPMMADIPEDKARLCKIGETRSVNDTNSCTWYIFEDRWISRAYLRNAIADGGFEWSECRRRRALLGFARPAYGTGRQIKLASDVRGSVLTHVLILDNQGEETGRSGVISPRIAVASGQAYILGGWLRTSNGGKASIGYEWWSDKELYLEKTYAFVAGAVTPAEWMHYAGIITPPMGVNQVEIWLLNYESPGQALFDEVTFFPVMYPPHLQANR